MSLMPDHSVNSESQTESGEPSDSVLADETSVERVFLRLISATQLVDFPRIGIVSRTQALQIARWLRPAPNGRQTVALKTTPPEILQQLGARKYGKQFFINSVKLNRFLLETFTFTTVSKCEYPLTTFVPQWLEAGVDLKRIALLLFLTEGGGKRGRNLYFYNRTKLYHDLLVDCVWKITGEQPTSYMIPSKYTTKSGEIRVTPDTEYWRKQIVDVAFQLSPSLKTKPAVHQSSESYFREPQPDASLLLKGSQLEKELLTLLLVGTEGYVTPFTNPNGFCAPNIGFRCGHPTLLNQFLVLLRDVDIHMTRVRDKDGFAGVGGAHNLSFDTGRKILQLVIKHGDILGTIHGNSRYHQGYQKAMILLSTLDTYLQQKQGCIDRQIPAKQLHKIINQRIDNQSLLDPKQVITKLSRIPRIHRNVRSKGTTQSTS